MKRKIFRRNNMTYEIVGVCETINELKKYIKEELDNGTPPQHIIVTDGNGLTFRLLNEELTKPGV